MVSEIFLKVMEELLNHFLLLLLSFSLPKPQWMQQASQPVPCREEWIKPDFLRILFSHPTDPALTNTISLCFPVMDFSICLQHCQVTTTSKDLAAFLWTPSHILWPHQLAEYSVVASELHRLSGCSCCQEKWMAAEVCLSSPQWGHLLVFVFLLCWNMDFQEYCTDFFIPEILTDPSSLADIAHQFRKLI